jgi:hypothetical protein
MFDGARERSAWMEWSTMSKTSSKLWPPWLALWLRCLPSGGTGSPPLGRPVAGTGDAGDVDQLQEQPVSGKPVHREGGARPRAPLMARFELRRLDVGPWG